MKSLLRLCFTFGSFCILLLVSLSASSYAANPVAWYSASGNNALDSTVNHHDGTAASDVTFPTGRLGQGFSFPGTDNTTGKNVVTIPDSSDFKPSNLTVSAWVKFSALSSISNTGSASNVQFIVTKQNTRPFSVGYSFSYYLAKNAGNRFTFGADLAPGTEVAATGTTVAVPGRWYHVVGTYDHASFKLYVNGKLEAQTAETRDLEHASTPLYLGRTNSSDWDFLFKGVLDEVQIYDTALTPTQIPALDSANAGTGLISWWPGNGNANDVQGGNNGTLQNGATFATGEVSQAIAINAASSNYVSIPDSPSLHVKNLTIDAWVNFASLPTVGHIFGKALGGADDDSYILAYNHGALVGYVSGGPALQYTWSPTIGQWYHVAYTFDGSMHKLYVDGGQVAVGANTAVPSYDDHAALIGADYSGANITTFFDGKIDEVDLFERALSGGEINAIYTAGATGKPTGPALSIADAFCVPSTSGTTNLVFTVNVARPNALAITVDYATLDGSAIAGTDYTSTTNSLTIPANTASATITVPVTGNASTFARSFYLTLSNPSNASINRATATGTIFTGSAVADFFTDSNTTTQLWQYGYTATDGTGFTNFDGHPRDASMAVWNKPSVGDLGIVFNLLGSVLHYNIGTYQPTDELALFENPDGKKAVLRWKAPASGNYQVSGLFEGIESAGGATTSDVSIVKNGDTANPLLFNAGDSAGLNYLNGYQVQKPFSFTVTVNSGDTLDFRVGLGSNNQYSFDGTGLKVTVVPFGPPPGTITFSATGPASAGAPIQFDASTATGWNVRVQAATTTTPVEGDWSDLNDGNGGAMTEISATNYRLTTAAYPAGANVRFRAIAAKTAQTDVISVPLGPFVLKQAVLSIGAKLTSTSDFANGYTAYIDDQLIYRLTFTNSGDANAKSLRVTATVPDFQYADIPLLVKTTAGSTTVTLASGDTSQLQVGGTFASGPGLGGSVVGNPNGTTVYIPVTATITSITDANHFVISQASPAASGSKTVSVLVKYGAARKQFKESDIVSLSPGGTYVPETSPGAGDAKLVWNVGDLQGIVPTIAPFGYTQYVTFSVKLTGKVAVDQSIGIGNDYKVESTSTPKQPVAGRTGFESGSPNVSCRINGSISFKLTSVSTYPISVPNTVMPGGFLTYSFALYNRGATAASNPVAVVEVPDNVRYADSYTNGMKGVFVTSGTQTAKLAYRAGSPLPQLVIKFSAIAAKTTVLLQVTFQAKWADPTAVTKISTINYGATFLNPTAPSTIVTEFTNLFNAANSSPFISGSSFTYTVDTVTNAAVALPAVGFTVAGATGPAPLKSTFTNTTTGTVTSWKWDFGDGTTSTAKAPPMHPYALAGSYTVSLTATNAGGSRTITKINAVSASGQDFFAFISDPTNKLARSLNQSGVVKVNLAGSLDNAPDLHLWKRLSNKLVNTDDGGDGNLIDLVKPGELMTFRITAMNVGGAPADEVYVSEAMPDHCTLAVPGTIFTTDDETGKTRVLTPSEKASKLVTLRDPDGRHLKFTGLHLEPGDTVEFSYRVRVDSTLIVPPPTDPPLLLNIGASSIGSGSTTETPVGFATAIQVKVVIPHLYAQPKPDVYIKNPQVSANVATTAAALDTLYAKTPSATPLVSQTAPIDATHPPVYIDGVERYYVHYENTGDGEASGVKITFPLPANTAFYRASWVTLAANNIVPGGEPMMPGTLVKPPTGGSITSPGKLVTSGNVVFNLARLPAGGKGDVMVEAIIAPVAVQVTGSQIGGDNELISIVDNTVPPPPPGSMPPPQGSSFPSSHQATLKNPPVRVSDRTHIPEVSLGRAISASSVVPGSTFTITYVAMNQGNLATNALLDLTVPQNTTLLSVNLGDKTGTYTPTLAESQPGSVLTFVMVGDNLASYPAGQSMFPHTASSLIATYQVSGAAGDSIVPDGVVMRVDYHVPIRPDSPVIRIVTPSEFSNIPAHVDWQTFGINFSTLKNGVNLVDIRGGNVVAQGAGNVIAQGAGNLLTQDGAGVVAAGPGYLLAVEHPLGGAPIAVAPLLASNSLAITQGKLGNLIVQDGSSVVAAGAGNVVSAGAGNLVSTNGGNIIASGAGNVIAQGAGNVIAQGAGNVVAQGAGNIVGHGSASVVAQGAGNVVSAGAGN